MVQVIVRALDILEFVAQHGSEPVQLYKIAERLNLASPTTANIVQTLVHKNYLEQMGRKKGYRLGAKAYHLTSNPSYNQDLATASKDLLKDLTKQLNETSLIAIISNNKRVILHIEECDQPLQVKTTMIADVYATSTGRLLIAYMSPKELENLIKAVGMPSKKVWPGTETRAGLDAILQEIRAQELVQVISVHHTVGFAVPVYRGKEVIASISIFIPQSRYTEALKEKLIKLLHRTAKKIKERLDSEKK